MKKLVMFAAALAGLVACGHKDSQKADAASDSLIEAQDSTEIAHERYFLTKDSLGPVRIGAEWKDVPEMVEGLYTMRKEVKSPDCLEFMFVDGDRESFAAYDFGEGKVDVICLFDSVVGVQAPRGEFRLGSPFSKVLELPGVKAEWCSMDDEGQWYWTWEGLWIGVGQDGLAPALSARLYNSAQAPTGKDFTGSETIGFIGTGLPY